MTAFQTSDLPAGIDTVEKLAYWAALVLEFNVGDLSYRETSLGNEYLVSVKAGRALDGTLRVIPRVALELTEDYQTGNAWEKVKEFNSGTIPANLR